MSKQTVKRAVRLVQIRELLKERPRTVEELAEMCDVSASTIRRDLADLQAEPLFAPMIKRVVYYEMSTDLRNP